MNHTKDILKETYNQFNEDDCPDFAAALSYYTIFSLAPLLLIAIVVAGFFFGEQSAKQQMLGQLSQNIGPQGAQLISEMIDRAAQRGASITASAISIITILLGATRVFNQLKKMLNRIWDVKAPERGAVRGFVMQYVLSFLMILVIGALLLLLIVASTVLIAAVKTLGLGGAPFIWHIVNFVISVLVFTPLFAVIFKVLPDLKIKWSDIWVGAFVTSLLFTIGRILLGFYLTKGSVASPYGAAGSLVVLLLFFYYSGMILFLGAEFTEVYSRLVGSRAHEGHAARGHIPAASEREAARPAYARPASVRESFRPAVSNALRGPQLSTTAPGGGKLFLGLAAFVLWRRIFGGKV